MTTPEESMESRFADKFGVPVRDGAMVKLTQGSDTMLISQGEILKFIRSYGDERERKAWEEARDMVKKSPREGAAVEGIFAYALIRKASIYEAITTKLTELS